MRPITIGWMLGLFCWMTPITVAYGACFPSGQVDYPVSVDGVWQALPHPNCSQTFNASTSVDYQVQPFWVEVPGTYHFEWPGSDGDLITLYVDNFDSTAPLDDCVRGDAASLVIWNVWSYFASGLQANRQYYLVSTNSQGFVPFDSPYMFGPGKIHLGTFPGLGSDLSMSTQVDTEMPETLGGTLTFTFEAENLGTEMQESVQLSSRLHPAVSYVADSCGGSVQNGQWSSDVGSLPAGGTSSCEVTTAYLECRSFGQAATVDGQDPEDTLNNTSSVSVIAPAAKPLLDGGFELGNPNPHWSAGSPLATGGAHRGDWYLYFEIPGASASQTVVIPESSDAYLTFYFQNLPALEASGDLEVFMDGVRIWSVSPNNFFESNYVPSCWQQQAVDISAFADGGSHILEFRQSDDFFSGIFAVDDVAIEVCPVLGGDLALTLEADTTSPGLRQQVELTATAMHLGGEAQSNVTVKSTLPEHLAYVGDTCGGSFAAGVWSWDIGSLNSGEQQSCNIQVVQTSCRESEIQGSILGGTFDSPHNNGVTLALSQGVERVVDGGFELGNPHPSWMSTHASHILTLLCGDGTTSCSPVSGYWWPHTGNVWAWLRATDAVPTSRLEQTLTIPSSGEGFLEFWLRIRESDDSGDYLQVSLDGMDVALLDEDTPAYHGGYRRVLLDVSPWADDQEHTLTFAAPTNGTAQFHFDDVSLAVCPRGPVTCPGSTDPTDGDADGVPDACDRCDPGDDFFDSDFDAVPDACDVCAGFDDAVDVDDDTVPDGCDECVDVDEDGVCVPFDCNDGDATNACSLFRDGFESGDLSAWSSNT